MFFNYLKVAVRSVFRNKLTAFINIAGLALAILCCLVIYFYVDDELRYDRHHQKADHIYRVTRNFLSPDGSVSLHLGHIAPPFGPLLKNDFTDIRETARVLQNNVLFTLEENGERKLSFRESNTYLAEPAVFNIFTIPVLQGDPEHCLERPFTVMLSDKMALKYFGTENVLGRSLKADNLYEVEITGVFRSFPDQSHWHPDFLVSFSTLHDDAIYGLKGLQTNWGNNSFATYMLVNDEFDPKKTEAQFPAFLNRHMGEGTSTWTTLFLQPLTDIHLHSHLDSEVEANGNINDVYMMSVIGLFIILIACFNFINLSTARATKRAKEVGLRKVAGAFKGQLITQYISESVFTALLALVIALVVSPAALGWLNDFTGKSLHLTSYTHVYSFLVVVAFTLFIGILAGLYPAVIISSFKPALILKGQQGTPGKGGIRKALVVAQFAISIVLIIATVITFQQLSFMNNRALGYAKDQVVILPYLGDDLGNRYEAFHQELLRSAAIKNAGRSSIIPTGRLLDSQGSRVQQGDSMATTDIVVKDVRIDHDFFDTYDIPFVSGRDFSRDVQSDDSLGFILNEAAVKMIGWTNQEAVGKTFQNGPVKGQVVGVVKDFHFESLHEPIVPVVFHPQQRFRRLSVRIAGADMQAGIAHLEKVWAMFLPQWPLDYTFLSDRYQRLYETEKQQSRLFVIFSGLAIFIASLGLFGLATFNTLQRVREIGIRKVLGASVPSILRLLSREIIILILVANSIAWPVAWYFMREWLNGFAYHVTMNAGVYVLSAGMAILIAVVTVSTQTIRAAMTNPANTLRHE